MNTLLQFSGGQAKTLMFVHISPEPDAVGETISTLKFAERVASVELGAAKANKEGSEIRELKEQVCTYSLLTISVKSIDDAGIDIYKKDLLFCRFRLFASRMH
jgi:kinesin family member C2/C3